MACFLFRCTGTLLIFLNMMVVTKCQSIKFSHMHSSIYIWCWGKLRNMTIIKFCIANYQCNVYIVDNTIHISPCCHSRHSRVHIRVMVKSNVVLSTTSIVISSSSYHFQHFRTAELLPPIYVIPKYMSQGTLPTS